MEIIKVNIFDKLKKDLNIELNDQQKKAAIHKEGPAIVLAVPGAGKTTTMVVRIYMLIKHYGIKPQNILTMTFSRASAKDMKERYIKLFGSEDCNGVGFSTIHSFALSVIKNYEKKVNKRFQIIEGNSNSGVNKIAILKRLFLSINSRYIAEDELEQLCNDIGLVKNMMIETKNFHKHNLKVENFLSIYKEFEAIKNKSNYIDFDDMLTKALEILKNNKDILEFYRNQYKYVLIDEGQDTSLIQHEIIKLLVSPNNNLFLVADDDQSIYGFRGADPKMLNGFNKSYPGAKKYFIEKNYRSSQEIVNTANEFIKINPDREIKNMTTGNRNLGPVNIRELRNDEDQIKYIIKYIRNNPNNKTLSILYRNNISAILLIDMLDREKISFTMRDTKMYCLKHWIIQDLLAFMNFSIDFCDIEAFERIYYKMDAYLSKPLLYYLKSEHRQGKSIIDTLLNCPSILPFESKKVRELRIKFSDIGKLNPSEAIDFILSEFKYNEYIKKYCEEGKTPKGNTDEILYIARQLAKYTPTLIQYICRIGELEEIISKAAFNNSKNILSTIHGAKGLEFDKVILMDLIEGRLPCGESLRKQEEGDNSLIYEEARIFYVGITRAREELTLLTVSFKNYRGTNKSRFLNRVEEILNPDTIKENSDIWSINTPSDDEEETTLPIGAIVNHSFYGNGTVVNSNRHEISINFKKEGVKTFPSSAAEKYIFRVS